MNINDKIDVLINIDTLFDFNNPYVDRVIDGESYLINSTYIEMLETFRSNTNMKFIHTITNEIRSLGDWMNWYKIDISDPKSIQIFLSYAVQALKIHQNL